VKETIEELVIRINKELGTEGKALRRVRQNTPLTRFRPTQLVLKELRDADILSAEKIEGGIDLDCVTLIELVHSL